VELVNRPVAKETPVKNEIEDLLLKMSMFAVNTGIPDLSTNIDHYLYGHPKVTGG
jgi:hypothetical protein